MIGLIKSVVAFSHEWTRLTTNEKKKFTQICVHSWLKNSLCYLSNVVYTGGNFCQAKLDALIRLKIEVALSKVWLKNSLGSYS